jgi:hypothetical protein
MWGTMREIFRRKSVDNNAGGLNVYRLLWRWELG